MGKIIIADHDRDFREMAIFALRFAGHEAFGASDGGECLRIAKQVKPDLILVEVNMPVIDGYDPCRLLKQDEVTASIPVVLMQSPGQERDAQFGIKECGEDIIFKPIDPDQLTDRVKEWLKRAKKTIP